MAAVDFCPQVISSQAPDAVPGSADFSCAACGEALGSQAEQRVHCKSERHVYNTKRRLAGLRPIPPEAWERKLRESRGAAGAVASKGTAHLKAGKAQRRAPGDAAVAAEEGGAPEGEAAAEAVPREETPFSPRRSLFDRQHFETVEECLRYMWRTYGFSVPDQEYCTDVPKLLEFLSQKLNEPPHACLFCNRKFPDAASVRRHMLDKSHSRIGTEARTRRGRPDEFGTEELQEELEEFYDFTASTREVTERITDPKKKIAALHRFFDRDRDGFLDLRELGSLWAATTEGAELSEALYVGACSEAGAPPERGVDPVGLGRLYAAGLADLDAHFAVLQGLLAQMLTKKPEGSRKGAKSDDEGSEEEVDEDAGDEEDEEEDSDEDDSDAEVVECDDEAEFEEVMRILGLQSVTILENGDLRLPSGNVAVHRDVAYIWRQRGPRMSPLQLAAGGRPQFNGRSRRAQLMLSNAPAGTLRVAISKRQEARQGKRIVAVLRSRQHYEMKMGLQQNILQKQKPSKFRTIFGDGSGGH